MEKFLIVNGDDFGCCKGVNEGIILAHKKGILSSTTILAGGDAFSDAVKLARENPKLSVGLHVCLLKCKPTLPFDKIPSLVDEKSGKFHPTLTSFLKAYSMGKIDKEDIYKEVEAQFEKLFDSGITPSHFDAHKHSFIFPPVRKIVFDVAEKFGVKVARFPFERKKYIYGFSSLPFYSVDVFKYLFKRDVEKRGFLTPQNFFGLVKTGKWSKEILFRMIENMREGINELMTHPGIYDESLEKNETRLKKEREVELKLLMNGEIISFLEKKNVKIVSYRIFEEI